VEDVILIASPGRSGSTMLTDVAKKCRTHQKILKTHLLPPSSQFVGKILFIFSNPDQAAESALHRVLNSPSNGKTHFLNVESSDYRWFKKIGENANNQTETNNLLGYDALGCVKQLEEWLHNKTQPCDLQSAQILAIKFEHLWEPETAQAIKEFLQISSFKLPPRLERGYDAKALSSKELAFRKVYNLGTDEQPYYRAYDKARELWEQAPPFQFLNLRSK